MISFAPTEDQQLIIDTIKRYVRERVQRAKRDADEERAFPPAVLDEGWKLGLLGGWLPEEYGGLGEEHSATSAALFAEELGYGDLSLGLYLLTPALFGLPVLEFGSDAQKARWLPLLAEEKFPALTAALTESGWNFDPAKPGTTARRDGDSYVLNGAKVRVPLAAEADAILVYATENGQTQAFIVEKGAAGLQVGEREQLMGLRALPTYSLTLTDCRVPASARLGEGQGIDIGKLLNFSKVTVGGLAVGVARAALENAVNYAKERQAFGRAIAQFQSIAFMMAEMQMEVDAARLMVWEAAWNIDKGCPATRECALGARYADETAMLCSDRTVQIYGGHGYIRENGVEQLLRDARSFATLTGAAML